MGKITFNEHINSISGKLCRKSKNAPIYKVRRFDGATFAVHQDKYKTFDELSSAQKLQCKCFAELQKRVREELADTTKCSTYTASWTAQKRYTTLRGYVSATLWATQKAEIIAAVSGGN